MTINRYQTELEFEHNTTLGESPVWDEDAGLLYWVDILSGVLFAYDPATRTNTEYLIDQHLGAVSLRASGGLLLAMKNGFASFDPQTGQLIRLKDPEIHLPDNRFNDAACDPRGRIWAGTLSYQVTEGAGSLYCLDQDVNVALKLRGLTIPNGMAWNTAADTFYFIDSADAAIYSFAFDVDTAEITDRKTVLTLGAGEGLPDGMTIDREDKLWIAIYNGRRVIRVDPETSAIIGEISVPVPQVTSCTFGGPELNELFITTAREHMTKKQIEQDPLSGSLFKATLPCRGYPAWRFMG